MTLIGLIPYLKKELKLQDLLSHFEVDRTSYGSPIIFLKNELNIYSDVIILSEEEANDRLSIEINGENFIYLIEVDLIMDVVKKGFEDLWGDDIGLANRILEYCIYDA